MTNPFIRQIRLDGFLSFAPASPPIELRSMNVLIGPNGSGKSNLLDALSVVSTSPSADQFRVLLRRGGGIGEWVWKGPGGTGEASIEVALNAEGDRVLDYRIAFAESSPGTATVTAERLSGRTSRSQSSEHIHFQAKDSVLEALVERPDGGGYQTEQQPRGDMGGSALQQLANKHRYPDAHRLREQFGLIHEFRDWTFGRWAPPRRGGRTDEPTDRLDPGGANLAMMLQELGHLGRLDKLNEQLRRFLPRAQRLTTRIVGGVILPYLHEEGAREPIPATRLSDGTLRFIAILATLLAPLPPTVICIEEPELGLHPDALSIVAELLVEASQRTQLIVTTHSDALLSSLVGHEESVLVCDYVGGTQIRRLKGDDLSDWLEKYRLGDLWRMGHLGGNP